jgi:hypothetical protein
MQKPWKEFASHTHIVQAVTLPWQCHPASIFTGMLVVITFHIRLNDTHMRGLEVYTVVARNREAASAISFTICRTYVNFSHYS